MKETNEILEKRGKVYGGYLRGIKLRDRLLTSIYHAHLQESDGSSMQPLEKQFFVDICSKLIRLAISPRHIDSWRDIAGYATLIANCLEEENKNANK